MKRKLKGLLSLWLAVMMILSTFAVVATEDSSTGTVYVYQKTAPIAVDDFFDEDGDITPFLEDGTFEQIDNFDLEEPINTQLEALEKTPEVPAGYEFDSWKLWHRGSGMIDSIEPAKNADGLDIISLDNYDLDYKFLEPIWGIKYEFTKQPVANDPSVEVNYPDDVAAYQWYEADPAVEITAENATVVDDTNDYGTEGTSSYSAETGWTGAVKTISDEWEVLTYVNYYFTITLKTGDTIIVNSDNELSALVLLPSEGYHSAVAELIEDGVYAITATEDETYTVSTITAEANATITAELVSALDLTKSIEGQTNTKLNATEAGTYICEATFEYNYLGTENPIKIYSDRVTLEEYTITFDAGSEDATGEMEDATVLSGSEYELPECGFDAPEGKEFDAWEVDDEEYEEGDKITVEADTTVKALWKNKASKVATPEFTPDGGKFTTSSQQIKITCDTEGATIYYTTDESDPTEKGREYSGPFTIKKDTTIKAYAVKDGLEDSNVASAFFDKRSSGNTGSSSSSSGSSSGGYSYYTVKFDENGGLTIPDQTIKRNNTVEEPENPTKYGYEFDGWYTDEAFADKYDFDKAVTKSFTLYAKWTEPTLFDDVNTDDWFYDSVKYVVSNGLFNGMSDTSFGPNTAITRAMFVTVLYRAEGSPEASGKSKFEDVVDGSYYETAVIWSEQNKIVKGMSDTEFAPDELITREQFATIMYRYAKFKGYLSESDTFDELTAPDAELVSDWAYDGVAYCIANGIISGYEDGTIKPQGNTTRAEAATILKRFIEAN